MFQDPGKTAEDNISNALGCGCAALAIGALCLIGVIIFLVMVL